MVGAQSHYDDPNITCPKGEKYCRATADNQKKIDASECKATKAEIECLNKIDKTKLSKMCRDKFDIIMSDREAYKKKHCGSDDKD
jgi:hypothetical protein